jgi:hypothetical protein
LEWSLTMAKFDSPRNEREEDWERLRGEHRNGEFRPDWVAWDSDYHRDPARRMAIALEYIAWTLGQINNKMGSQKSEERKQEYPSSPIPRK